MLFVTADRVFDGQDFLPEGTVLVLDNAGCLIEFGSTDAIGGDQIEKHHGILLPGFINTHCHLELSHLKGQIPMLTGLPAFAREIIVKRNSFGEDTIQEAMVAADREMLEGGIVAVGDISNTLQSSAVKTNSKLHYHTFVELIGLNPDRSETIFNAGLALCRGFQRLGLSASLAPHAPYSTSLPLIARIAAFDADEQCSLSIHNQESAEEDKFMKGEKSAFYDLYNFLKIDLSWFTPPGSSSLKSYSRLLPGKRSILVHNTFTQRADLEQVSSENTFWCFCPGANLYIEGRLPEWGLFMDQQQLCLGTDSLASNGQLNLVVEASILLEQKNSFELEAVLRMLTFNGARALGIEEHFGRFIPGKNTGLNLVACEHSKLSFIKKIA